MPKRWCQCRGCQSCQSPDRRPGAHGALYDADATRTLKCPDCQTVATAARNARTGSSERGYGTSHQQTRKQLLAQWRQGDPCALCGRPMVSKTSLDLAHNEDRSGYKGLSHAACNRATNTRGKR